MGLFQERLKVFEEKALDKKRLEVLFDCLIEAAQENCDEGGVYGCTVYITGPDSFYDHICEFEFLGQEWTRKNIGIEIKRVDSTTFTVIALKPSTVVPWPEYNAERRMT